MLAGARDLSASTRRSCGLARVAVSQHSYRLGLIHTFRVNRGFQFVSLSPFSLREITGPDDFYPMIGTEYATEDLPLPVGTKIYGPRKARENASDVRNALGRCYEPGGHPARRTAPVACRCVTTLLFHS